MTSAAVPLLMSVDRGSETDHSSRPCTTSLAANSNCGDKKANAFCGSNCCDEDAAPGAISATSTVPILVPSLIHSSRPVVPLSAVKNSVPLPLVNTSGYAPRDGL